VDCFPALPNPLDRSTVKPNKSAWQADFLAKALDPAADGA